jgi:hypothetical protein
VTGDRKVTVFGTMNDTERPLPFARMIDAFERSPGNIRHRRRSTTAAT